MPLHFGSEKQFREWERSARRKEAAAEERVRAEEARVMRAPRFVDRQAKKKRTAVGRAVGHLTRPGHRRRASSTMRTLLGPLR